jgi:hypothetical protein
MGSTPTLAAADSFLVSQELKMPILIQITVAKEHPVKIHGVSAILKTFPANWKSKARRL